jgi:hypothetical protein
MNLIVATQIVKELSEWVNYHEETGLMPLKPFKYSLLDTAVAVNRLKLRNEWLHRNNRFEEKIDIPNEAQIAGVVLCSQLNPSELSEKANRSFACANGVYASVTKYDNDLERLKMGNNKIILETDGNGGLQGTVIQLGK